MGISIDNIYEVTTIPTLHYMNLYNSYEKFRSLDEIGYPNYAIDINGYILNTIDGTTLTPKNEQGYILNAPFHRKLRLHFPIKDLVGIAWKYESEEIINRSIYRDTIFQYKYFYTLPTDFKYLLPYMSVRRSNHYWILKNGEVWRDFYCHKLTPVKDLKSGYYRVGFPTGEHPLLHRLVAIAFIPIPKDLLDQGYTYDSLTVNHIDGNKDHNYVENLEWCTLLDNVHHGIANHLLSGTIHPDEEIHEICRLLSLGLDYRTVSNLMNLDHKYVHTIKQRISRTEISSQYDF